MGKMKDTETSKTETKAKNGNTKPMAVVPPSAVPAVHDDNPWAAYGEAAAAHAIVGELLKFTKGDYVAGRDGHEVAVGTKLVAYMDTLEIGWFKWEDNKPVERRMGLIAEGFRPPRRNELGDDDEAMWELGDDGQPKDPWQFSNNVVMADAGDGTLYTFTTSSKGGLGAVGELCKAYGQAMRSRPSEWPVVALEVGSYAHSNKAFGRIKFPVFKIVGWTSKEAAAQASAAAAELADTDEIPF